MTEESKEREILRVMRKVLTSGVREITPEPGMRHPLSAQTIDDVRMCLGLISARERELADAGGEAPERPYFTDQKRPAEVIPVTSISKSKTEKNERD